MGTICGTAIDDLDKGAYIVWGKGFQVSGTEKAAAAVDAKPITRRCGQTGVDAESTVCRKECED